jgi:predicted dienelactone hydrolase
LQLKAHIALVVAYSLIAVSLAMPASADPQSVKIAAQHQAQGPVNQTDVSGQIRRKLKAEEHQIASMVVMLRDTKRKKVIPVHISYPLSGDKFPVIVFSHGGACSGLDYSYLASYWARHGYVCLQPFHEDSIVLNRQRNTLLECLQIIPGLLTNKQAWTNRTEDVSFIISSLSNIHPKLAGKLDSSRVGVSGHSLGALSALLLGGARIPRPDLPPRVGSLGDKRVKAIVALSPQGVKSGPGKFGFDDRKCFTISVPAMFVSGDRDQMSETTVSQNIDAFRYSPPGDKYYASLYGANHATFFGNVDFHLPGGIADLALDPANAQTLEAYGDQEADRKLVQEMTTLFWDVYLKGDSGEKMLLKRGGLTKLVGKTGVVQAR